MNLNKYSQATHERYHKIKGNQDYDISFFTEKMKISKQEVIEAIDKVGNNREKLENYFKNKTPTVFYH